jgi:hypothetical protein
VTDIKFVATKLRLRDADSRLVPQGGIAKILYDNENKIKDRLGGVKKICGADGKKIFAQYFEGGMIIGPVWGRAEEKGQVLVILAGDPNFQSGDWSGGNIGIVGGFWSIFKRVDDIECFNPTWRQHP